MSWTWLDDAFKGRPEEEVELEMELRRPAIEMVVQRILYLRTEREQRSFRRQAAMEAGESDEPEFDDEEQQKAYELREETARTLERNEEAMLERQLEQLGARMKRPYEDWNEDEKLMEYLERERD